MNRDRDNNLRSADGDPVISAQYRAIATERTPEAVDATVLQMAEAATKTGLGGFTAFWLRPMAFVATLALSLAVVLELTSNQYPEPVGNPQPDAGGRVTNPVNEAPRLKEDFRKSVDSPTGKNQYLAVPGPAKASAPAAATAVRQPDETEPAQADSPAGDGNVAADFAEMIEANSKLMQEQNVIAESAEQGLQQSRATATFSASAVVSDVANVRLRPCDAQQTADPREWWHCIAELEKAGRQNEANAELDLFNKAYPEFKQPEALPSE